MIRFLVRKIAVVLGLAVLAWPKTALACAACYGQSDSAMAKGLNWGILVLGVVAASVLGAITSFFVYIARRSSAASRPPAQPENNSN